MILARRSRLDGRCLLLTVLALAVVVLCAGVPPARAAGSGAEPQYGEQLRAGGFDACWFDNGSYDGKGAAHGVTGADGKPCQPETAPAPGQFVDPVGFAASTSSDDAFVLDRTSQLPGLLTNAGNTTTWRLQEIDAAGQVVGVDRFSLPADTPNVQNVFNNNGEPGDFEVFGLAYDPALNRVYALLVAYDRNTGQEMVYEILAWTANADSAVAAPLEPVQDPHYPTVPNFQQIAQGVSGYPAPAILSAPAQLSATNANVGWAFPGESAIQGPSGVAIADVGANAAQDDEVAVQGLSPTGDPAGIVAVSPDTGRLDLNNLFDDSRFANYANDNLSEIDRPGGLSTNPVTKDLTWLDDNTTGSTPTGVGTSDSLNLAELPAATSTLSGSSPDPILLGTNFFDNTNATDAAGNPFIHLPAPDGTAVDTLGIPPEGTDSGVTAPGSATEATRVASAEAIALGNGLYAAVFAPGQPGSANPENPANLNDPNGPTSIWSDVSPGIRLLDPSLDVAGNGWLSEPGSPHTLVDTLGNAQAGAACSLTDTTSTTTSSPTWPSLAAGASGAIWVLTKGQDSTGSDPNVTLPLANPGDGSTASYEGGRQLIELVPRPAQPDPGWQQCPGATGSFTEADSQGHSVSALSGQALTVTAGTTVTFDSSAVETHGAAGAAGATTESQWSFGDGSKPATVSIDTTSSANWAAQPEAIWPTTTEHTYTVPNPPGHPYAVTVHLWGDYGETTQTGYVNVLVPVTPVAQFTISPASPVAGQTATFDASASTAHGGQAIAAYSWSFGDGQYATTSGPTVTHAYASAGVYTATVKTIGSDGFVTASQSVPVTVAAPVAPATPPAAPAPPPAGARKPAPAPSNVFKIVGLDARAPTGAIVVRLRLPGAGAVTLHATFTQRTRTGHGLRRRTVKVTLTFARLTTVVRKSVARITLKPSAAALAVLRRIGARHNLRVTVVVAFLPSGGTTARRTGQVWRGGLAHARRHAKR